MTRRHGLELVVALIGSLLVVAWVYRGAIEGWALSLGAGVLAWRILAAQAGIARPGRRSLISRLWAPLEAGLLAWLLIHVRGIGRAKRERIPAGVCTPIGDVGARVKPQLRGNVQGDEIPF